MRRVLRSVCRQRFAHPPPCALWTSATFRLESIGHPRPIAGRCVENVHRWPSGAAPLPQPVLHLKRAVRPAHIARARACAHRGLPTPRRAQNSERFGRNAEIGLEPIQRQHKPGVRDLANRSGTAFDLRLDLDALCIGDRCLKQHAEARRKRRIQRDRHRRISLAHRPIGQWLGIDCGLGRHNGPLDRSDQRRRLSPGHLDQSESRKQEREPHSRFPPCR